jgi:hypothetical protein
MAKFVKKQRAMQEFRKISGNYSLAAELDTKSLPIQDIYLQCQTSLGAVNIQLPEISELQGFLNQKIYINDVDGNASVNNITVICAGSDKINDGASVVISTNGASGKLEIAGLTDFLFTTGASTAIVGALGGINTSSDNNGFNYTVHPAGIRSLKDGTIKTGYAAGFEYGDMVGTFDPVTGVWTAPETGYYDFTTLFSLNPDPDFNALFGPANPNGFITNTGSGAIPAVPAALEDYIGIFQAGITDIKGGILVCSGKELVTYDTSQIIISASYTGRRIAKGAQYVCRWLNKMKNPVVGQAGNSFHISITHIK